MIKEMLINIIGEYKIDAMHYEPVDVVWICACVVLIICIIAILKFLSDLIRG